MRTGCVRGREQVADVSADVSGIYRGNLFTLEAARRDQKADHCGRMRGTGFWVKAARFRLLAGA